MPKDTAHILKENINSSVDFVDFLSKSNFAKASQAIQSLPWSSLQKDMVQAVSATLNGFSNPEIWEPDTSIPPEGLKGVYFCLGDENNSLTIAGSVYFNEQIGRPMLIFI